MRRSTQERDSRAQRYAASLALATSEDRVLTDAISKSHQELPYYPAIKFINDSMWKMHNQPQPPVPSHSWVKDSGVMSRDYTLVLRHTAFHYRDMRKDWGRYNEILSTAILYEFYFARDYRDKLLQGPTNILRDNMYDDLREFLPTSMVHTVKLEKGAKSKKYMWFYDGIYYPRSTLCSTAVYQAELRASDQDDIFVAEIDNLTRLFNKMTAGQLISSRFPLSEGPYLDSAVANAQRRLIDVSSPRFANALR